MGMEKHYCILLWQAGLISSPPLIPSSRAEIHLVRSTDFFPQTTQTISSVMWATNESAQLYSSLKRNSMLTVQSGLQHGG